MSAGRGAGWSVRWFRMLLRLYPADFRDEMGDALVEAYVDRVRGADREGGALGVAGVWWRALVDSLRNGPGERVRPAVRWRRTGNWGRDMELTVRRLVRAPLFSVMVGCTLAVGLGAFGVVYAVVDRVLIADMPYADGDGLYYVWRDYRAIFDLDRGWLAGTDVAALQEAGGVIEDAAGVLRGRATLSVGRGEDPMEITAFVISPNLFALLGARPALGRVFEAHETGPDRPPLMVLTHELWSRLGGDTAMVGGEVRLNGEPFTVIGVMPRDFTYVRNASLGPPQSGEAFVTHTVHLAETNPNAGSYAGLMRVRRGTPAAAVAAAVEAAGRIIDERDFQNSGLRLYAVGLKRDLVARVRPALIVLGLAGVFLVLVLMVNLATLLLARAAEREREFAVARALGANPVVLARATLLEGGLLGLAGGAAAALIAVWGTRAFVALAPLDLPRREYIAVDARIAGVIVGTGVILGLLAALVPAVWAARASLASLLQGAAVRGGGGHGRMRRGMVVVQVALSLVLLSTGAVVVRSFDRLLRADPGFDPTGLLTMRVPIPPQLFPDSAAAALLQDRVHAALAALPGVSGVSAATALPMTASANQTAVTIPGAPGITGDRERDEPLVDYIAVRGGYTDVMRMRVAEGRDFSDGRRSGVREALVDRALADHFFPGGSVLGARIAFGAGDDSLTVVGVVDQARQYDVHRDDRPQLYIRAEDWGFRTLSFVVRTPLEPRSLIPQVRGAVRAIDPQLALADVRTMDEIVGDSLRQQRIGAVLMAGFALGALLLAALGLYGIVAGSVTRRRHEIAVRLALGADHRRVLRLVLGEGGALVGAGIVVGAPGIWLAGRVVRSALVDVSPFDPMTLGVVALGLGLVASSACYVPARRVLGIEPGRALRQE